MAGSPNTMKSCEERGGCFLQETPSFELNARLKTMTPARECPADIDFFNERNGHFIFGEYKRGEEPFAGGAARGMRMLKRMPGVTLWLIRVHDGERIVVTDIGARENNDRIVVDGGFDDYAAEYNRWLANPGRYGK